MIPQLSERLDAIFAANEDIRVAELQNDKKQLRRRTTQALSTSCLLLRDIGGDQELRRLAPPSDAFAICRDLQQQGKFDDFLRVERDLLLRTGLEHKFVEQLITAFRMLAQQSELPVNWPGGFQDFVGVVCRSAQVMSHSEQVRPLLKRTLLVGGGALTIYTNAAATVTLGPWAALSITLGWGVIIKAVVDQVSDW